MVWITRKQQQQVVRDHSRATVRAAYGLLLLCMALFAYVFLQRMKEVRHLQAQQAALQQVNQLTRADNQQLQHAIAYYRTPSFIENGARMYFGYTKPGEVAVMSSPVEQRASVTLHARPPAVLPPLPVWKQWWNSFYH